MTNTEMKPGARVTVTIEATIIQAFPGSAVHVRYDEDQTFIILPHQIREGSVAISPAADLSQGSK
jgi:hypothetical protein